MEVCEGQCGTHIFETTRGANPTDLSNSTSQNRGPILYTLCIGGSFCCDDFYPCWAHLVYWVGFGPAMACPTHLKFWIFIDFRHFWPLSLKLLFFGNSVFFRTLRLGLISAKPYYQNARIDRGVIFGFQRNLRNYCKLPVRSGFPVVSLISVFSSYFINLSGTLCGRPRPPHPGPHGGGGGGPHGSGGPTPPGPTAAAVGGGPHGSGGPRPLGGRPPPAPAPRRAASTKYKNIH